MKLFLLNQHRLIGHVQKRVKITIACRIKHCVLIENMYEKKNGFGSKFGLMIWISIWV